MKRSARELPLRETRREAILDVLRRDGAVRVSELTEFTGVTPVTIRRDILRLEEEGVVRRVHGGVVLAQARSADGVGSVDGLPLGSGPIGMVVPSLDYYWPEVIEGAQQEAARHGMSVALRGSSYETDDILPHVEYLLSRAQAAGLILAPNMKGPHSREALETLAGSGVPLVLVERAGAVGPFHTTAESVVSDHAQGAAIAMRYLAELGHRRIGLVIGSGDSPTAPHVRQGWLAAREELGTADLNVVDEILASARDSGGLGVDAILDRCLASGTTALLVHPDQAAASITQQCENRGLCVPGDLSVIAYDDEVAELFTPPLTAVRPHRTSLGRAAVNLLVERMREPDRPAHHIVITPSLRVRATTGAPRSGG